MQAKAAKTDTLGSNTIRWVIGPSGTLVIFSDDVGLPNIFNSVPCRCKLTYFSPVQVLLLECVIFNGILLLVIYKYAYLPVGFYGVPFDMQLSSTT